MYKFRRDLKGLNWPADEQGFAIMGQTQDSLDRQLTIARGKLAQYVAVLDEKKVGEADRKRDSIWRNLDAECRQIRTRMVAVDAVAAREAECAQRKEAATAE